MSPYGGKERFPVSNPVLRGPAVLGADGRATTTPLDLSVPFVPDQVAVVDLSNAIMTRIWLEFLRRLVGTLNNMAIAVANIPSASSGTIAQQPTGLGPTQAGLLYSVLPPYAHAMRWSGTVWEFAPGDPGNGFLSPYVVLPGNPTCWQECDGTATDYLVAGGTTITTAPYTTPDLKTTGRYLRGHSVAGVIVAAQAAGISLSGAPGVSLSGALAAEAAHTHGFTTPAHTHTGRTDTVGNHNHSFSGTTSAADGVNTTNCTGGPITIPSNPHTHTYSGNTGLAGQHDHALNVDVGGSASGTTAAGSAHTHGLGTLAATGAVGTLAATNDLGSIPNTYTVRFYFRR